MLDLILSFDWFLPKPFPHLTPVTHLPARFPYMHLFLYKKLTMYQDLIRLRTWNCPVGKAALSYGRE